MKIHLNESELRAAVITFIESQGFDTTDKEVSMAFTAGRRERGHYVDIVIGSDPVESEANPFGEPGPEVDEASPFGEPDPEEAEPEVDDNEPAIFAED